MHNKLITNIISYYILVCNSPVEGKKSCFFLALAIIPCPLYYATIMLYDNLPIDIFILSEHEKHYYANKPFILISLKIIVANGAFPLPASVNELRP